MSGISARLCAGVFLVALAGCAGAPQTRVLLDMPAHSFPRQAELREVPFYPQEDFQCGPSALAMALNHAGVTITPDVLKPEVYLPGKLGSLQVEMTSAVRRHGLLAYQLPPKLETVLQEVSAGTPVVVLQNLALSWYPIWHYSVVIGYDLERAEIILRSGRDERLTMPMSTFERTWQRGDYWALVAVPPGRVPVVAEENSFVAAVSALEKGGHISEARKAYQAVLQRWPENLLAQIGAGNTAYRMKDIKGAEAAFRSALKDHPDSAIVLNNLAQVLLDQGKYADALPFARRAVELAGGFKGAAQSTLHEIETKLAQ